MSTFAVGMVVVAVVAAPVAWCGVLGIRCEDSSHFGRDTGGGMG